MATAIETKKKLDELNAKCIDAETTAESEKRKMTKAEQKAQVKMLDECDDLEKQYSMRKRLEDHLEASNDWDDDEDREARDRRVTSVDAVRPRMGATDDGRGGYKSFTEYLGSIRSARTGGKWDSRLEHLSNSESRDMSTSLGSAGGFAVPKLFLKELDKRASMKEPWLDRRKNVTVPLHEGGSLVIPRLADGDRSSDEVAGLKLRRTGEGSSITSDQIVLESSELPLFKAGAVVTANNELLTDNAVGLESELQSVFGDLLALTRAKDFIDGSGAGEPMGILNGGDLVEATDAGVAGRILTVDIGTMISLLEGGGNSSTAWLIHASVWVPLVQLAQSATAGDAIGFVSSAVGGLPPTLLGFPIFVTDSCKAEGTPADIVLANLDQYLYFSTEPRFDVSKDEAFTSDKTRFRLIIRDNGMPRRGSTLTDRQGSTQANFITLGAR